MIFDGLKVTLILAFVLLILAMFFGFVFCISKPSKMKIISTTMTNFIAWISDLPIVLTLMICFYLIFSDMGLNEILVVIIYFLIARICFYVFDNRTEMNEKIYFFSLYKLT